MPNKFQKSVKERLDAEAARRDGSLSGCKREEPAVSISEAAAEKQWEAVDVSAYLSREQQRTAKNKTFYLDIQVIEAVRHMARSQGVTDSKLVNDILRGVLGISSR